MKHRLITIVMAGLVMMAGCTGKHITIRDETVFLDGCYPLPNCVSSTTWVLYNRTPSFELLIPGAEAWPMIKDAISAIPRTEIMEYSDVYIHAKCKTRVFRFVDHLELVLQPDNETVSVRSSSSVAIFDFFANRLRLYSLRKKLRSLNIIR